MKIEEGRPVFLTGEEAKNLISRELSHGSDGRVIKYDNTHLLKLYHSRIRSLIAETKVYPDNDEDVKIYHMGQHLDRLPFEEMFRYLKHDGVDVYTKLRSETAINSAVARQHKVINTRLPSNPVYIDGKFAGCLIIKQRGLQIHSLTGMPLGFKKKVMLRVLENVNELYENNIYHVDLDNSPFTKKNYFRNEDGVLESVGHSHVLVNPITLKPMIIDLDGKSTIYTDFDSPELEFESLQRLNRLILEFMLAVDLDYLEEDDELADILERIGVHAEYIDMLAYNEPTYGKLYEFVEKVDNIKTL